MGKIVIGLDGAHWELLTPWIEAGELPSLRRIRSGGIWGDMQSCLPPVTSPNWKCYSTGKNPGKLGVYWWEVVDVDNRTVHTPQSFEYRSAELWDYLNEAGYKTGVVNMPTTYPPRAIDGWMIAGGPGTEPDGYTAPPDLQANLEREFDYRVRPASRVTAAKDFDEETIQRYLEMIDLRFKTARWLLEDRDADFVHVTIFYINVLQHFLWDHEYTLRAWKNIDDWLDALMTDGHSIILMSDHGSNEVVWEFNVNHWLERKGYLHLTDPLTSVLNRVGVTQGRARQALSLLPFSESVKALMPSVIKDSIPTDVGRLRRTAKTELINWGRSSVLASGQGPVYLLPGIDGHRERLKRTLMDELADVRDPDGNEVFANVYDAEEMYEGPYRENAPDIVLDQNPGYHLPGHIGGEDVFHRPTRWAAENKQTAMFAAWGDDMKSIGRYEPDSRMTIVDLFPTLLAWHDVPVPDDIDGSVQDIFASGSGLVGREPRTRPPIENSPHLTDSCNPAVSDRLEDLGYL